MMHHLGLTSRVARLLALLMLAMFAIGLAPDAWANPTCSGGTLALTMPNVTITHDTAIGATLGSAVLGTASFTCSNLPSNPTNEAGIQIFNLQASQLVPATLPSTTSLNISTLTFATNLTGIGIRLTISPAMRGYDQNPGDQQPNAYVVGYVPAPGGGTSVNYSAQLIVTGATNANSIGTISSQTLLNYEWYSYGCSNCNGASTSASLGTTLTINSGSTVALQGCSVNTASQNLTVTLPTIGSTSLTGAGTFAGQTSFPITLTCQPGTTMFITMTTANPNGTYAGVVQPTAGDAKNVGVQVLYGGNSSTGSITPTAVTFNSAQNLGASPNGALSLQYYAQYFQTGTPVGTGHVSATVTFTMSYQ